MRVKGRILGKTATVSVTLTYLTPLWSRRVKWVAAGVESMVDKIPELLPKAVSETPTGLSDARDAL